MLVRLKHRIQVEAVPDRVTQLPRSPVGHEPVSRDLNRERVLIPETPLLGCLVLATGVDADHSPQSGVGRQELKRTWVMQLFRQQLRARTAVRMVHLDTQPVRLRTVVREVESRVVDVHSAETVHVLPRGTDADAGGLTVPEIEDPDLVLERLEPAPLKHVLVLLGAVAELDADPKDAATAEPGARVRVVVERHEPSDDASVPELKDHLHLPFECRFGVVQLAAEVNVEDLGLTCRGAKRRAQRPQLLGEPLKLSRVPFVLEPLSTTRVPFGDPPRSGRAVRFGEQWPRRV